jgi:gamma-glutamyltranspeptidase/glutathione hydrolase
MSLLDPTYLASARRPDRRAMSMKVAQPGTPGPVKTSHAPMPDQPEYGTSHISIVDGSGQCAGHDHHHRRRSWFTPDGPGLFAEQRADRLQLRPRRRAGAQPIANRVQPGKRPRSSMAPTLVFDKATGQLVMSGGSPGGALIIHYTAKTLYGVLNWGMTPQQAINLPNFGSLNGPSLLEEKRFPPATVEALRARRRGARDEHDQRPAGHRPSA